MTISSGYMLNKTTAVPAEITLRGPTSELDQVSSIVAPVQMDGELADTTTVPATLELRDEEGNAFTPQYISMESDSANVTLTVYQERSGRWRRTSSARRMASTSRACTIR